MADDPTTDNVQSTPDAAQNTGTQTDEKTVPYARFKEVNDKLRAMEKSLNDQKAAADAAQAAALVEQGKFKEAYENAAKELPTLKEKAEQAAVYEKWFSENLTARMKAVPEHLRPLLEKLSPLEALSWLETNADKLTEKQPGSRSNLEGQVPGGDAAVLALTPEEREMAERFGVKVEDYAAMKARTAIERRNASK